MTSDRDMGRLDVPVNCASIMLTLSVGYQIHTRQTKLPDPNVSRLLLCDGDVSTCHGSSGGGGDWYSQSAVMWEYAYAAHGDG